MFVKSLQNANAITSLYLTGIYCFLSFVYPLDDLIEGDCAIILANYLKSNMTLTKLSLFRKFYFFHCIDHMKVMRLEIWVPRHWLKH
jgi:hypothetical protein